MTTAKVYRPFDTIPEHCLEMILRGVPIEDAPQLAATSRKFKAWMPVVLPKMITRKCLSMGKRLSVGLRDLIDKKGFLKKGPFEHLSKRAVT